MERETRAQQPAQLRIFKKALPLQLTLHEVARALGSTAEQKCLCIGDRAGILTAQLGKRGGEWSTVVVSEQDVQQARDVVGDAAFTMTDGRLPFEDKIFDAIVVVDFLELVEDDSAFVEECHRVMKHDGRMVVNVRHYKPFTLVRALNRTLGVAPEQMGLARPGYTEPEMFRILKHGFDVGNLRTYKRFFVSFVDAFVARSVRRNAADNLEKDVRTYTLAAPFYRFAFQLDILLFMSRGFSMICTAKRRAWLPRRTPVLTDGRRISEAVLSRPLG